MNILFIGATGNYPFEISASNSKNELIAKGLCSVGYNVTIINSPIGSKNIKNIIENKNSYIKYILFPKKLVFHNLINLYKILKSKYVPNQSNTIIISLSYARVPLLLLYKFYSKLLGYKLVLIINEWRIPISWETISLFNIIRDFHEIIKIKLIPVLCNGYLPISSFINNKLMHHSKPSLIVPALSNTDEIIPCSENEIKDYFLYCGIAYYSVALMVLKAFIQISKGNNSELVLIVSLKFDKRNNFKNEINSLISLNKLESRVKLLSDLKYVELIEYYLHSLALLIPLDINNLKDISRFPNKIGEYAASGRPIITMNVGDISKYFSNNINCYFVTEYTPKALSKTMNEVLLNKEKANKIGNQGRRVALQNLNYKKFGKKLYLFFENL